MQRQGPHIQAEKIDSKENNDFNYIPVYFHQGRKNRKSFINIP